ncbi:hypothetical protein CsSME_00051476 [Camellia sinensis var. sinensis]
MENLTNKALEAPRDFENFSALNCIDLSSPDILNSVSLLKQACLDSGFFYVINHGISQEFMDEVFYQSKSFFDLPVSEKMKVLRNKKHRGYTPLFNQSLDPGNQIHGLFCYHFSSVILLFSNKQKSEYQINMMFFLIQVDINCIAWYVHDMYVYIYVYIVLVRSCVSRSGLSARKIRLSPNIPT